MHSQRPLQSAAERVAAACGRGESHENRFFLLAHGLLLGVVLVGFARTFYLHGWFARNALDLPLYVHGATLTAWFVLTFAQACLIEAGRRAWRRRVAWLAAVVVASSAWINMRAAGRIQSAADPENMLHLGQLPEPRRVRVARDGRDPRAPPRGIAPATAAARIGRDRGPGVRAVRVLAGDRARHRGRPAVRDRRDAAADRDRLRPAEPRPRAAGDARRRRGDRRTLVVAVAVAHSGIAFRLVRGASNAPSAASAGGAVP